MTIETTIAIITKSRVNAKAAFHLDLSEYDSVKTKTDAFEHIWEDYQLDHDFDCYVAVVEFNTTTGESKTLADRNEIMRYLDDREDEKARHERDEMSDGELAWLEQVRHHEDEYKSR
jgi:hypothetical protein